MRKIFQSMAALPLKPQGVTLVTAAFLPIFAIVSMFPIVASMIEHFAQDPDARAKVPLMVTAPGLTIALLSPFVGVLVDRFGRRRLLLWCTALYGVFGFAPFLLDDLNLIFASRLLLGVTEAGILTIVNTLIADYWDDTGRKNWLFIQGVVGPFMASGVILLSGTVADIRWNGGFLVYLVAFPIWIAMLLFVFEPKVPTATGDVSRQASLRTAFPLKQAITVALVTLFASALYYVFIINGSIAFKEVGVGTPGEVGRLTAIPSLFIMLGAVIFRLGANRSYVFQLTLFIVTLSAGLLGIGLAKDAQQMVVALCVQQTGAGMAVPALIAWAQTKFDFEHRGRGLGIWVSSFFFGQFSSPWLVHRLDLASGSMQGAFKVAGIAGVTIALAYYVFSLLRHSQRNAGTA